MDMGTIRGLLTVALLLLFFGVAVWAFSRRRSDEFAAAARAPLDDDRDPTVAPTDNNKRRR